MTKLLKHYMALVVSQSLRVPLSFLNIILLARILNPEGYGDWAIIMAAGTIFHSVLFNWTQTPFIRFGKEEWEKTGRLSITWSGRWPLIILAICLSLIILFFQPFGFLTKVFKVPSTEWMLVFMYIMGLWLSTESQSLFQILDKINVMAITQLLIVLILTLYLYFIFGSYIKLSNSQIIIGIVLITLLFWGVIWLATFIPTRSLLTSPNSYSTNKVIGYGWILIPTFLIGFLSDWGDQLLVNYFLSSFEVGLFQAAYQIMLAVMGLASPITTIFLPKLISLTIVDKGAVNNYFNNDIPAIFSIWCLAITPLLYWLPNLFTMFLGYKYAEAMPVLIILNLAIPGACLSSLLTVLFNLFGRLKIPFIVSLIMSLLNIVISIILIPKIGLFGAAVGTVVSYIIAQSLYLWEQSRFLNKNCSKIWLLFSLALCSIILPIFIINLFYKLIIMIVVIFLYLLYIRKTNVVSSTFVDRLIGNRNSTFVFYIKLLFGCSAK
jgi:O-antigen/teichoic acid export membrane protein